jgi:hypothetical protein
MGLPQGNVMGLQLPLMEMFCLDQGLSGKFKTCPEGQKPPDCSSVLDLLKVGCSAPGLLPGTTTWYIAPLGEPDADIIPCRRPYVAGPPGSARAMGRTWHP